MKKISLVFCFIVCAITSFAQYPNNTGNGNDSTLQSLKDALRSKFVNVTFADTAAANLQRIRQYPGAQIFTSSDNAFWTRNRTATRWIRVNGFCAGLLNGGVVSWSGTGLVFNVTPANYCINNNNYNSNATAVTLATANPSLPRLDVIAVDTFGLVVVITGTPSATPAIPQINPQSQLYLTSVLVPAGATIPGGITTTVIYDENTGGEWTHSTFGTITGNFGDAVFPFHLVKDTRTTNINASARVGLQFTNGSPIQAVNYNSLNLHIAPVTAAATNIIISLTKEGVVNTVPISVPVSASTAYQTISVPLSSFVFTGAGDFFDGVQIQFTTTTSTGYYVDYVNLQSGITPPPTGGYWTKNGHKLYPTDLTDSVGINTSTPGYPLDVNGLAHFNTIYLADGVGDTYVGTPGGDMGNYTDATTTFTYGNNKFGTNGSQFWINNLPTASTADSILAVVGDSTIKIPIPASSQNLQQTLDNGNTSTTGIVLTGSAFYDLQTTHGELFLGDNGVNPVFQLGNAAGFNVNISAPNTTTDRDIIFPDKSGTIALTDDITTLDLQSVTDVGSQTTNSIGINSPNGSESHLRLIQPSGATSSVYIESGIGTLDLGNASGGRGTIRSTRLTQQRDFELPDSSGIIALKEDLAGYIPLTGTTPGNNVTGNILSNNDITAESLNSNQTISAFGQITSGTNSHQGSFELFDNGPGNSATMRTDVQSGTGSILLIPDLLGTIITSPITVDNTFANAAGNIDLSGIYATQSALDDTAAAIRADFPSGGGGGIDSVRQVIDTIKQYSGGTGTTAFIIRRYFNVKDFGAINDSATNNTVAYDSCLAAIVRNGGGVMYFPSGVWTGRIKIPAVSAPAWVAIKIEGESPPLTSFGTIGTFTFVNKATILRSSDSTGPSRGGIIEAWPPLAGGFSNVQVSLENIEVRSTSNPKINGVDLQYAQQMIADNVFINTGIYNPVAVYPQYGTAGLMTPGVDNGGINYLTNVSVSGYYNGILFNEHTNADNLNIYSCYNGINALAGTHSMSITKGAFARCNRFVRINGACKLTIDNLDLEHADSLTQTSPATAWQVTQYDIYDTANLCKGHVRWADTHGGTGTQNEFKKLGGSSVYCDEIGYPLWARNSSNNLITPAHPITGAPRVAINNQTPGNTFDVNTATTGDALAEALISTRVNTQKGLVVQGMSGQSADFMQVQQSSGNILSSLGIPTSGTTELTQRAATASGTSGIIQFDGPDRNNAAYLANGIATGGGWFGLTGYAFLSSSKNGSGTQLPLTLGGYNGSSFVHWITALTNGNVGINNISASEKLDVTGNIRFSGALMPNNSSGTSGQHLVSAGSGAPPTWKDSVVTTSGTYTPTLSNTTNVTSSTPVICHYTRTGNQVTVTGSAGVTTTLAVATILSISLPIASNFTDTTDAAGLGQATSAIATNAYVQANATSDLAELTFIGLSVAGSGILYFTFSYSVL